MSVIDDFAVAVDTILEKSLEHRHHRRFAEAARPRKENDLLHSRQEPRNHIGLVDVIAASVHDFGKKVGSRDGVFAFCTSRK